MGRYITAVFTLYITSSLVLLGCVFGQQDFRFILHKAPTTTAINDGTSELRSFTPCLNPYDDTFLGPEGDLYAFDQANLYFSKIDLITDTCRQVGPVLETVDYIITPKLSPSRKYIYYIQGVNELNDVKRMNLETFVIETVINPIANTQFTSIDFANARFRALTLTWFDSVTQFNQHHIVEFDPDTDVVVEANLTSFAWNPQFGNPVWCNNCPPVTYQAAPGVTCCISVNAYIGAVDNVNLGGVNTLIDLSTVVGAKRFRPTPWNDIYTVAAEPDYLVSLWTPLYFSASLAYSGVKDIHPMIVEPSVSAEWLPRATDTDEWCRRNVTFTTYNFLTGLQVEVSEGTGFPFKTGHSESVLLGGPTLVLTRSVVVPCTSVVAAPRVRINFLGDVGTTVFSLPVALSCAQAPPECFVQGTLPVTPATQQVQDIVPILECIAPVDSNNFIAFFGYNNKGGLKTLPAGDSNSFSGGTIDLGQTTSFVPGRSPFFPRVAFTAQFQSGSYTWRLTNYEVTFDTGDSARYCPSNFILTVLLKNSTVITSQEETLIEQNIAAALNVDESQVDVAVASVSKKRQTGDLTDLEVELSTQPSDPNVPAADPTELVNDFIDVTAAETQAQEVFNPLDDPEREVLDVKTNPTGLESEGQVIPGPQATPASSSSLVISGFLSLVLMAIASKVV